MTSGSEPHRCLVPPICSTCVTGSTVSWGAVFAIGPFASFGIASVTSRLMPIRQLPSRMLIGAGHVGMATLCGPDRGLLASSGLSDWGSTVEHLQISICQADSDIDERDPTGSVRRNFGRVRDAVHAAAEEGTRLVIFGEGYLNGYQSGKLLPEIALRVASDEDQLGDLTAAVDATGVSLVFGATTSRGSYPGSLFNSAVIMRPGRHPIVVDKTHLSEFRFNGEPVGAERMDWAAGSRLGPVFDIDGFAIGVEICHDIVFPEVARSLCMRGAEVVINVSAAVGRFRLVLERASGHQGVRELRLVRACHGRIGDMPASFARAQQGDKPRRSGGMRGAGRRRVHHNSHARPYIGVTGPCVAQTLHGTPT